MITAATFSQEVVNPPLTLANPGTIIGQAFNPEVTRPFFEEQFLSELSYLCLPEAQLREEYFTRSRLDSDQYEVLHVQTEWMGWKKGVKLGHDLWGSL